jgi:hypothetical protein
MSESSERIIGLSVVEPHDGYSQSGARATPGAPDRSERSEVAA